MSGIYIPDMEMPKSCITGKLLNYEYCPFFGCCSKASAKTERPSDCPLVEVPPHGRLKDVDEILDRDVIYTPIGRVVYPFDIDSAPTVIPASKGK